ncbi:MAG: OmpA family protein [Paludibacteraceae bacterium]|nr:OmpA family protein [Paludibacteraceae bacterium]
MHFRHIFFLASICALSLCCTSCSISARVKRADKKYNIGEYYTAADMYTQIYRQISTKDKALRAHVAFQQGECYRILNNSRATTSYKNAIRYQHPDSIVFVHYAQALQYQGKYSEAIKQYDIYLAQHPNDYVAQAGKYACIKANEWKKAHSRYKVAPAKEFNAKRSSNYAPAFISSSGDALVFTSNRQEQSSGNKKKARTSGVTGMPTYNLYSARKNAAGKWEDIAVCEGLTPQAEENEEEGTVQKQISTLELGVCSFSADGKTMYFTYAKPVHGQDVGAKIYTSQRASGEWSEAQELVLFKDSSITVGHPSICPTGDTLYFVSDAPGGYGGKDIYMAINNGGSWEEIINLGPTINTSDDEMFPYIRHDGRLYFSSKGHPGLGGLDLFYAEKQDTTYNIFNMGVPFNSSNDDFGITFAGEEESGFFSSNRGQKRGYDLIYSFHLPQMEVIIEGVVTNNDGQHLSDASLRLIGNDGTNVKMQTRRDGTYRLKLNKDVQYAMLVTSRGFLNQKHVFSTEGLIDSYTYTQNFQLASISKPVTMSNIFYEFGSWELTQDSEEGLKALVQLLNDNPNITLELSAHTDMVGNQETNKQLSLRRAQAVVDYLIKHGIDSKRLTAVGYGKDKPVVVDEAISRQYTFLPQGQVLDEAFILSLPQDQQEVCNSLNRRTEFRVLKTTYNLY